ncbi:MAG: InlB B-repeat-containing protein, partial [Bacilli bacterium]|nr:InlB B-repeat-containing protein [Bacilli bacterium]
GDKLYSAVGVGSSSMEWTTEAVVKSVMIAEGTTSFKFGHTKAGYSISYDAIRLVKIGSYMATNNIVFDENNAAKVEGEAYSLKHTIFTNTGEETDYTANYSYNEVTYPTNLDGSVEDDEGASGGQYLHGLYRQGWNQSKGSNMSGEVVYRIKLSEEAKVKIKARIKSNMETEKVCLDLKVDGANKGTFRSANTWVEVEPTEMTLAAGVHTISFVGQQLSGSENYTSVLGDLDCFELDKIPVPKATLKGNYQGAPADTVVKATDDGKVPELPAATRAGDYKFLGWFTEEEGGTKVEAGADITADMNLYAHWLEYTWTEGTKVADVTPASSAYGDVKYTMLKADADGDNDTSKKLGKATAVYETYDITGAIPAGTYDIEILGRNSTGGSSFNLNEKYAVYNGAMEDANKITLDAGTYKSFGFNESSNAWTTKCGSITIAEGATSISIAYLGGGNSAYIDGIRLVVRTANTTPAA